MSNQRSNEDVQDEQRADEASPSPREAADASESLVDEQALEDAVGSIRSVSPTLARCSVRRFTPDALAKYAWYELDESDLPLLDTIDAASRRVYERLGKLPGPRRYDLGNFRVDPYRSVSFEMIPALGEVSYSEVTEYPPGLAVPPAESGDEEGDRTPSPLMRFLQLTDDNVPVPLMLRDLDDSSGDPEVEQALRGRDLSDLTDSYGTKADFLSDNIVPAPDSLAVAVEAQAAEPAFAWTCFNGGADVFSSTYCQSKGTWNCDSSGWKDLTRSSGSKNRWVSHSRVAACGGEGCYVEHQALVYRWQEAKWRWIAVKYPLSSQFYQLIFGGHVKYWKHVGNKKRKRKIRIYGPSLNGSSYFRSWTAFYN